MLEDQLSDQVGCYRSLPNDQNAGEPPPPVVCMPSHRPWAPLHCGNRGGCASSRLDHAADLRAFRTERGNPNGSKSQIAANLAALPAKFSIPTLKKNYEFEFFLAAEADLRLQHHLQHG